MRRCAFGVDALGQLGAFILGLIQSFAQSLDLLLEDWYALGAFAHAGQGCRRLELRFCAPLFGGDLEFAP